MRGSPLLRALLVFLLLLGLAPVLWQMTHRDESRPVVAPAPAAVAEQEIPIELAFTTVPKRVTITHLGREVWKKDAVEETEDLTIKVPWPKEGGELKFTVEWADDAPLSAMRTRLEDPERGSIERTLWGRGTKSGVLGFP